MEKSGIPDIKMNMEKLFGNKIFVLTVRLVLGGLFIYASMDKMANPADFVKVIHNYKILPISLENLLAVFLPSHIFAAPFVITEARKREEALRLIIHDEETPGCRP